MNTTRIDMHYVYNLLYWHQSLSSTFHAQLKNVTAQALLQLLKQTWRIQLSLRFFFLDRLWIRKNIFELIIKNEDQWGGKVSNTKYMPYLKT